jgi:hypothetical protein
MEIAPLFLAGIVIIGTAVAIGRTENQNSFEPNWQAEPEKLREIKIKKIYTQKKKSKLIGYLLLICLGGIGAHCLYSGNFAGFVLYLMLFLLAVATGGATIIINIIILFIHFFLYFPEIDTANSKIQTEMELQYNCTF